MLSATVMCGGALPSDAVARPRLSCATLKGKRLASTPKLRVVEQTTATEESVVYACVPPNGRVRIAAKPPVPAGEAGLAVTAKAGSWVALRFVGFAGVTDEEVGKAFNAATGKSYSYWNYEPNAMGTPAEARELDRVLLNTFGDVALAEHEGTTARIVAFEPNGRRHVLDSGARAQISPGSLKLSGRKVQWVDAGVTRSASV